MKRVILDIDEKYATVLSITVIGCNNGVDVAPRAVDITKYDHITIDENANWEETKDGADYGE